MLLFFVAMFLRCLSAALKRMDLATLTRMVVDNDGDTEFQDIFGQNRSTEKTALKAQDSNVSSTPLVHAFCAYL